MLLFVVFGIKAAVFPLFFWLPDSYPTAPSPITAVFAGLAHEGRDLRHHPHRRRSSSRPTARPGTLFLVVAGATMVVGVLGAIAQDDIKRILSFTIVSQIGYMVMGLGLFTVAGVAAAVFSIVHHIIVKTTLFLTGGLIEHASGSSRLRRVGGMVRSTPFLAAVFLLAALEPGRGAARSPASSPSSVWSKPASASEEYVIVGISLLVSLLTLFAMIRIWTGVFWSPAEEPAASTPPRAVGRFGGPALMVIPTVALLVCSLAVAVGAGAVYTLSERTARDLMHPDTYIRAVTNR